MKMYKAQNDIHCMDREKSKNIERNLFMPPKRDLEISPFLNKNKMNEDVFEVDLKLIDMAELQQQEALPKDYFENATPSVQLNRKMSLKIEGDYTLS